MRVVIAPDSYGGTLTAPQAARAIATGWQRARPADDVVLQAMSDGGEGLLDVLGGNGETQHVEVADPRGLPRQARWILRPDATAVIESAEACGLRLLATDQRDPLRTTTYGVGQLLLDAVQAGASRVILGLGGSATVDGGAGALTGLGFRLRVEDGSGLKIGGGELSRVRSIDPGWLPDAVRDLDVDLLADVRTRLDACARTYGPQKGATPDAVAVLEDGLSRWADVAERDLHAPGLRDRAGTGAAGGLGFGLAAGIGARLVDGASFVATELGLAELVADADLVVTGEGRIDATTAEGKVVGEVLRLAEASGVPVAAVAGTTSELLPGIETLEVAAPQGPGDDPEADVRTAAERLARTLS